MPWLRSTSDPQLGQLRLLVVVKRTGTTAPHLGQLKCLPCSPLSEAPSRRPCSLRSSSTTRSPRLSAGGWAEKSTDRTWPCSLRSSTSRYGVPGSGSCASSPWADTSRAFCTLLTVKLLRSEEHTSELQSPCNLVCRLLLEKKTMMNHLRPGPGQGVLRAPLALHQRSAACPAAPVRSAVDTLIPTNAAYVSPAVALTAVVLG